MKINLPFKKGKWGHIVYKSLVIMKITIILIALSVLQVSATGYGQEISINQKKASLEKVLRELRKQSGYDFFYNAEVLKKANAVSISAVKQSLKAVLDKCMEDQPLTYSIEDKTVIIREKNLLEKAADLLQELGDLKSDVRVTGTVKDDKGETLPGVSVKVKGASTATSTDVNGKYTIQVSDDAVLVFSYMGFEVQEIPVFGKQTIDVVLKQKSAALEEVVVVGFGSQKKVNLTGAVGTLNVKALAERPVRNVVQALQGLVTGLNISQNNGSLETNPSINIRGNGNIGTLSSSAPLVLIDQMEGDINVINPQDIESISVLKDAASAAVYGSRGAFGVILVTTKRGKAGKVQFNYNNNLRSTKPVVLPKMMDSYTFALFFNDASTNGGSAAFFTAAHLQRIKDYQEGKITASIIPDPNNASRWADGYGHGNANVDWYDAMYKDQAFSQEHNISLNGGNERTTFYISGNYLDQSGMMQFNTDSYNRFGLTAKVGTKINDQISLNYSGRFLRDDYVRPAALHDGFYNDLGRQGWPTLPLYDPNGFLYSSPSPALAMQEGGKDKSQKEWNYQQMQLVFEPVKKWKTFAEFNYRIRNDFRHWDALPTYNHDVAGAPYGSPNSEVYEYGSKENYFNTNIYSEYSKTLGKVHNFKIMAGFQSENTKYRDLSARRQGIINPSMPTIETTTGTLSNGTAAVPGVSGQYLNLASEGFFGRVNYDLDGRYLLEGNLRYDASSRFQAEKRWAWFPSVSAGWNVAKEPFWKTLQPIVNTFKFRASYGSLGNQNAKDRDWYPTYLKMNVTPNGSWLINGIQPNVSSAPKPISTTLTWETVKSLDFGLDAGFLSDRLTASVDIFDRRTVDMVAKGVELPDVFGTDVPETNNTDMKTKGFELEVAWTDKFKNGLGYNVRFLLSDYKSRITRYPNATGLLSLPYRTGMEMGEIWGYSTIGIAKSKAEMDAHLATLTGGQNFLGANWDAGDIMYEDYNKDGKLDAGNGTASNPGDRHIIGNNTPRYTFGFDAGMNFKGFDLRVFLQGVMKRDIWQGSYFFWGATNPIWWSTGLVQHKDYFRADANHPLGQNLNAYYPRPLFNSGKNQQVQTGYLQDASYIRLKNIQLGYSLPVGVTKRVGVQKLRFYISGENLWTGTKMAKMFDPETVDYQARGNAYPLPKVVSGGLSVTF